MAGLNLYAVVREAELVPIDEVGQHVQSIIRVEGELVSWVADPYDDGSDLKKLVLRTPGTSDVVTVQWRETKDEMPPIGSIIQATGDMSANRGSFYMQSSGFGAVEVMRVVEATGQSMSDVASDPDTYTGELISLEGFAGSSITNLTDYQTFTLQDHQAYGQSLHGLKVLTRGYRADSIESGALIEITGFLRFDGKQLRWMIEVQTDEIEVIHPGMIVPLAWEVGFDSWLYDVGKAVEIDGQIRSTSDGGYVIADDQRTFDICLITDSEDEKSIDDSIGTADTWTTKWTGRLSWSDTGELCVDSTEGQDAPITAGPGADVPHALSTAAVAELDDVAGNPAAYEDRYLMVRGFLGNAIVDDSNYQTSSLQEKADYSSSAFTLRLVVNGYLQESIEEGSHVDVEGFVRFDTKQLRYYFESMSYEVRVLANGTAVKLSWADDFETWLYDVGSIVEMEGYAIHTGDGGMALTKNGSDSREICVIPTTSDLSDIPQSGAEVTWLGRLTWSTTSEGATMLCIDRTDGNDEPSVVQEGALGPSPQATTTVKQIIENPQYYLENPDTEVVLEGILSQTIGTFDWEQYSSTTFNLEDIADSKFSLYSQLDVPRAKDSTIWEDSRVLLRATVGFQDSIDESVFRSAKGVLYLQVSQILEIIEGPEETPTLILADINYWYQHTSTQVLVSGKLWNDDSGRTWINSTGFQIEYFGENGEIPANANTTTHTYIGVLDQMVDTRVLGQRYVLHDIAIAPAE